MFLKVILLERGGLGLENGTSEGWTMTDKLPEDVKRYIMVELHCDMTQCKPCTFPDCPLLEKKRVDEVDTKTVELGGGHGQEMEAGKTVIKENVKRYLMVELSCDGTSCDPCTYPNCQRFVRDVHFGDLAPSKKPKVRRVLSIDKEGKVIS